MGKLQDQIRENLLSGETLYCSCHNYDAEPYSKCTWVLKLIPDPKADYVKVYALSNDLEWYEDGVNSRPISKSDFGLLVEIIDSEKGALEKEQKFNEEWENR